MAKNHGDPYYEPTIVVHDKETIKRSVDYFKPKTPVDSGAYDFGIIIDDNMRKNATIVDM